MRILLGGSPCTYWSIAQKNNRETEASGIGWELFKNFLIAKEKFKPDYFLYENNKSAAQPIKDEIKKQLGVWDGTFLSPYSDVRYIEINSALVSAQNRERFYVHNCGEVEQPKDRGILQKDVLESGYDINGKSTVLCANGGGGGAKTGLYAVPVCVNSKIDGKQPSLADRIYDINGKATAVTNAFRPKIAVPLERYNYATEFDRDGKPIKAYCYADGKIHTVYEVKDGKITIKSKEYPIKLPNGFYIIRKLTVAECRRLQTVPDWYKMTCSPTQNYKMLGNGWTIEIIKHILSHIPNLTTESVEVLSMYDGMSCGHIALKELGANVVKYYATEIDKYAIQTTQTNFPDTIQFGDAFQVRNEDWRI